MIRWLKDSFSTCELFLLAILLSAIILGFVAMVAILFIYVAEPALHYGTLPESNLCKPSFMCDR